MGYLVHNAAHKLLVGHAGQLQVNWNTRRMSEMEVTTAETRGEHCHQKQGVRQEGRMGPRGSGIPYDSPTQMATTLSVDKGEAWLNRDN